MGGGIIALPIVTTSCSKFAKFDITVNTPEDINFGFPEARTWNASINNFKVQPDSVDWSISSDKLGSSLSIESTGLNTAKITLSPDNISDAGTFNYKVKAIAHKGKSSRTIQTKDIPLKIAHISFNEFTIESDNRPQSIIVGYSQQTWDMRTTCFPPYDYCEWSIVTGSTSSGLISKLSITNSGTVTLQTGLLVSNYSYQLRVIVHKRGYTDRTINSETYLLNIANYAYNINGSDWDGRTSGSFIYDSNPTYSDYTIDGDVVTYKNRSGATSSSYVANNLKIPDLITDGQGNYYSNFVLEGMCLKNNQATLTGTLSISSSVKKINVSSFFGQTGLTVVNLGDGVEELWESCFGNCTGITDFKISANTHLKTIACNAFGGCTNLIKANDYDINYAISRHQDNSGGSSNIYYLKCDSLCLCLGSYSQVGLSVSGQTITGLISIQYGTRLIGKMAFSGGCDAITGLNFPTSLVSINSGAFTMANLSACNNINFQNIKYIGESAFQDCQLQGELRIPSSCLYIGPWAFYTSDDSIPNNLNKIYLFSNSCEVDVSSFSYCGPLESFECYYFADPLSLWVNSDPTTDYMSHVGEKFTYDEDPWYPTAPKLINHDELYGSYSSEQLLQALETIGLDTNHWHI